MKTETARLVVDHLLHPVDIGPDPSFSWQLRSDRDGAAQTAYHIEVRTSGPAAKDGTGSVWDSGVVESANSIAIKYAGAPLLPMHRYEWTVSVRDDKGDWLAPATGTFDTGLFGEGAWDGTKWISAADSVIRTDVCGVHDTKAKQEAEDGTAGFVFSAVNPKPVIDAWLCVSGLGVFEAYVNGKPLPGATPDAGDFLKPGFTHPKKTKHSFARNVTALLDTAAGSANTLAAEVSAGWWRDKIVNFAGKRSALRAVLELRHPDGTATRFGTDETWLASGAAGRVTHAAIFDGEDFDARIDAPWIKDATAAKAAGFAPATENTEFPLDPVPMEGPTIRVREDIALAPAEAWVWRGAVGAADDRYGKIRVLRRYRGDEAIELDEGETLVVDFAQNCAAVPQFEFSAAAGTTISAHPAEMLNDGEGAKSRGCDGPEGSVYITNYRLARTLARYTFSGTGVERYRPRFSFFGGRYLSVVATGKVSISKLRWVPVSSIAADAETCEMETGNADVNRFLSNVRWGQLSNYLSVPTDCPQRNERLGWTADTQVFCRSAAYGSDVYGFLRKWMRDMRDTQHADGSFTGVAPFAQYGDNAHQFGWADAGVIVPWTMWRHFGDTRIVAENWDAMVRYVHLVGDMKYDSPESREHQWSDWLSFEKLEPCSGDAFETLPDGTRRPKADALVLWKYLGCCYWLIDARMMADMAAPSGHADEKDIWLAEADRALAYLREKFVDPADGMLPHLFRDMQTPALFALALGLLEPEAAAKTQAALLANIHDCGDCLHTGFLGTSILMDTLTDVCKTPETAWTLLLQHAFPSWLYSVDQGATTVWERWNSYTKANGFGPNDMNSFNHYAYGAVRSWMFRGMAGIRDDKAAPGFKHFFLSPSPDPRIGHVRASYASPLGTIESAWRYEGDDWLWEFSVPPNSTATVRLPGEAPFDAAPGRHSIRRPAAAIR